MRAPCRPSSVNASSSAVPTPKKDSFATQPAADGGGQSTSKAKPCSKPTTWTKKPSTKSGQKPPTTKNKEKNCSSQEYSKPPPSTSKPPASKQTTAQA